MVNINWEQLEAVNVDEIGEEEAGHLYQQLVNVDVEDESDVTKLRLLFSAAQAVMQTKAVQAEVAIEELDLATRKLKEQLNSSRELASRSPQAVDGSGRLKNDREVERLRLELQDKERQLAHERRENEKVTSSAELNGEQTVANLSRLEDGERERRELAREMSQLNDDIEDYRRQLDTSDRKDEAKTRERSVDKIREKNRQISKLLEDVKTLESRNAELQSQVIDLRDQLKESTVQMDKTTSDFVQLKKAVQQSESTIENLKRENESYLLQIGDFSEQQRIRLSADDEILAAVNQRVDEWKAVLSEKEEIILKLRNENSGFRDSFSVLRKDSDKSTAIENRDSQIRTLKVKLEQATRVLEESASLIEKLKADRSSGDSAGWQIKQIEVLQRRLAESEGREAEVLQRLQEAEVHARERDTELADALSRVKQFEMGEYGLTEAVQEIKGLKQQLCIRDKQIEEITLTANHAEFNLSEISAENEELCRKLGLEPRSRTEDLSRSQYETKKVREKALSEVLQQEVDRLEEERIEMKQEIRKLAQIVGHRASVYGLTAEDAKKIQGYAQSLVGRNKTVTETDFDAVDKTKAMLNEVTQQVKVLKLELESTRSRTSESKAEPSGSLESKSQSLMPSSIDDQQLLDLLSTFRTICIDVDAASQLGLLRNCLSVATDGNFDVNSIGRRQSEMSGEKESSEKQWPSNGVSEARANARQAVSVQTDFVSAVEMTAVAKIDAILSEYLMEFQETSELQKTYFEDESSSVVDDLKAKISELQQCNDALEAERQGSNIIPNEHDLLVESLASTSGDVKRELAEMCRKLTVSRVNEKNLLRKCSALIESELQMRKANQSLRNELLAKQCTALHRVKYLERVKEVASFKITALQRALDGSVSAAEFEELTRQNRKLDTKYQTLLEKEETILKVTGVAFESKVENDADCLHLKKQIIVLEAQLQAAVDKLQSFASLVNGAGVDEAALQNRLALLELKELNERQRADHAVLLYEQQRLTVDKLKERNDELDSKFSRLTKMAHEQQCIEQELRDDLGSCITRQQFDRVSKHAEEIEAEYVLLKQEVSRLKEMTEVSQAQVASLESSRLNYEFETLTLRQQLLDVSSGSDEKALVGKLYRQLISLHISEVAGRHKLEKCDARLQKIEALCLRLEQKCDEKDQVLYHVHNESRIKFCHLKRMIGSLRKKLQEPANREQLIVGLVDVQDYKLKTKREYELACEERLRAEEAALELDVKQQAVKELIAVLKDEEGTQKILNWHRKMSELRLQKMKSSHELQNLRQRNEYQENLLSKQENRIMSLETTIAQLQSEHDEEQLVWEARESQLQRTLSRMDAKDHSGITQDLICVPNSSLPMVEQLEQAVQSLKTNSLLQIEQKEELKEFKTKLKGAEQQIKELQFTIEVNKKVISELQSESNRVSDVTAVPITHFDEDMKQALKVAQVMAESLKMRLVQKEETVASYERLLERSRSDLSDMAKGHQSELERLRFKDQATVEDTLSEMKRNLRERIEHAHDPSPFSEQITRMNELRDVATQQDNVISTLTEKLKAAFKEIERWQLKVDSTAKEMTQEKEKLANENDVLVKKLEREIETYREEAMSRDTELNVMRDELDRQRDENKKAPSVATKVALENLKKQLGHKEKQLAAMSRALSELKNDLRAMAEENVLIKANADGTQGIGSSDVSVQQMKLLQEKLDAALTECSRLKKSAHKHEVLDRELAETKENLDKQMAICGRLQKSNDHLQGMVVDLEAKVKRISRIEDRDVLEVETLRGTVRKLEEKLVSVEQQAEKPYDQLDKKTRALESWESSKRWQLAVGKLKTKLEARDKDVARLEQTVVTLRNAVARIDKEKTALERKTATAMQSSTFETASKPGRTDEVSNVALRELSRKYFDLQCEVTALKKQLFVEKDLAIEELRKRESFLGNENLELEAKLAALTVSTSPRKMSNVLVEELQSLRRKENELQEQLLKVSQENVELRFELEQAKIELPRFKDRVEYLEKYTDALRSEQIYGDDRAISAEKQRVGTSGKTPVELEKTIAVMKKVMINLQAENDDLKRKTRGDNKMVKIREEENARLKSELRELTERFGTAQSRDAYEKGTAKIVFHNERLLEDYEREIRANEALRVQLNGTKSENNKLRERITDLEASNASLASVGSQRWNSRLVAQLYEEKLTAIKQKLKCKTWIVDKLKELFEQVVDLEEMGDQRSKFSLKSRFKQIIAEDDET